MRGLVPHDKHGRILAPQRIGESLKNFLNETLVGAGIRGQVINVVTIPDFAKMFDVENEMRDYEEHMKLSAMEPCLKTTIVPKKYRTTEYYARKIDQCKIDQEELLLEKTKPSGHAFVVFDSSEAANFILNRYNLSLFDTAKLMCHMFGDTISSLF